MKFYPTLEETLARRFDDNDEVRDIVNHGIDSGYNGFIYNYEITQFFTEFEDEIEDVIEETGFSLNDVISTCDTFMEMRIKCVYMVAELFCMRKYDIIESLVEVA